MFFFMLCLHRKSHSAISCREQRFSLAIIDEEASEMCKTKVPIKDSAAKAASFLLQITWAFPFKRCVSRYSVRGYARARP
jgi:hypothetical protein